MAENSGLRRRVAVEKAVRLEFEPSVVHRHDRPVLSAREVRQVEGVPDNDVLTINRTVGLGVRRKTRLSWVLVGRVAGSPHFITSVLSDPQVLLGVLCALSD